MESSFKENLRSELDFHDLTIKELSARTDISRKTLDCYLRGQASMPPANSAVKIARVLGVSVEYLVTGEESGQQKAVFSSLTMRLLWQIIEELGEHDKEILLGIARVLKNHGAKKDA
jgi:transcriptional regulator with XRE-family HTH domain